MNDNPATGGAALRPGATEVCNGIDDCDGLTDEGVQLASRMGGCFCEKDISRHYAGQYSTLPGQQGLCLYAWCLMTSHIHMIMAAQNNGSCGILRDFKKFTSKQLIAAIENNAQESRKDWMLRIFREQGASNSRNKDYQFWRQDNQPKEIYSAAFAAQKINYIHNNPVKAGIVDKAEDFLYSSARDYYYQKKCGLLDVHFL